MYAEIEPLLMIRPPRGSCAAIARNAACAHRNVPVTFVSTTRCQSSNASSATGADGPQPGVVEQQVDAPEAVDRRREQGVAPTPATVTSVGTASPSPSR